MNTTYKSGHTCYSCVSAMDTVNNYEKIFNYKGKSVLVTGIKASICPSCGEIAYSSDEAKRIEQIVHDAVE